ncbi:MAG: type II secretion system F family protein [Patescibacteria group bacterium]
MPLFNYKAIDQKGSKIEGSVDALNIDIAIGSIQNRGLIISSITPEAEKGIFNKNVSWFERASNKDVVILSRQIATLFEAQVPALRIFRMLAEEAENPLLTRTLFEISDDLQGGSAISKALAKHPKVFSPFYVNMVLAGEESGKLDETFNYLADYLDRSYEVTSKAKNALIYPAFVIFTFVIVMILMLTLVIPKISAILLESGQEIPFYTRVVLSISTFFTTYGLFAVILLVGGLIFFWRYTKTVSGRYFVARVQLSLPYIGSLYRKLYLSRIADNMNTMLISGVSMIKAVEVTSQVVDNKIYEDILKEAVESIKSGNTVSDSFARNNDEIPNIMIQMIKVGEETGQIGSILKTLSRFYQREVTNAVDTLIDLIEPAMIVLLGAGVGILLASVLIPIYNISSTV